MSLENIGIIGGLIAGLGGLITGVWGLVFSIINSNKQKKNDKKMLLLQNQINQYNKIFEKKYLLISIFKQKVGKCFSNYWNFVEFLKNYNYYELADINNDPYHKYVKLFDSEVRELVEKYYMIRSELDDEIRVSAHKILIAFQKLVSRYKEDQRDCSYQGGYQMNFLLESLDKLNNEISHLNEVSIKLPEKLINIDVQ